MRGQEGILEAIDIENSSSARIIQTCHSSTSQPPLFYNADVKCFSKRCDIAGRVKGGLLLMLSLTSLFMS